MFPTQKSPKISAKFSCEICNYNCCKQSEYTKHILTDKHKNLQNPILDINSIKTYICNCGKVYKHYSTLHAHKKKCIIYIETKEPIIQNNISNNDDSQTNNLLIQLIKSNNELQKENQEFKNLILESKIKQNNNNFICEICNKQYMSRNGLWKHKKTCNIIPIENNNEPTEKELIMMLLKQNAQLIEQNAELVKNGLVEKDTSTL